jgi:cbb3-type cytochrome oxidase subunit 3
MNNHIAVLTKWIVAFLIIFILIILFLLSFHKKKKETTQYAGYALYGCY